MKMLILGAGFDKNFDLPLWDEFINKFSNFVALNTNHDDSKTKAKIDSNVSKDTNNIKLHNLKNILRNSVKVKMKLDNEEEVKKEVNRKIRSFLKESFFISDEKTTCEKFNKAKEALRNFNGLILTTNISNVLRKMEINLYDTNTQQRLGYFPIHGVVEDENENNYITIFEDDYMNVEYPESELEAIFSRIDEIHIFGSSLTDEQLNRKFCDLLKKKKSNHPIKIIYYECCEDTDTKYERIKGLFNDNDVNLMTAENYDGLFNELISFLIKNEYKYNSDKILPVLEQLENRKNFHDWSILKNYFSNKNYNEIHFTVKFFSKKYSLASLEIYRYFHSFLKNEEYDYAAFWYCLNYIKLTGNINPEIGSDIPFFRKYITDNNGIINIKNNILVSWLFNLDHNDYYYLDYLVKYSDFSPISWSEYETQLKMLLKTDFISILVRKVIEEQSNVDDFSTIFSHNVPETESYGNLLKIYDENFRSIVILIRNEIIITPLNLIGEKNFEYGQKINIFNQYISNYQLLPIIKDMIKERVKRKNLHNIEAESANVIVDNNEFSIMHLDDEKIIKELANKEDWRSLNKLYLTEKLIDEYNIKEYIDIINSTATMTCYTVNQEHYREEIKKYNLEYSIDNYIKLISNQEFAKLFYWDDRDVLSEDFINLFVNNIPNFQTLLIQRKKEIPNSAWLILRDKFYTPIELFEELNNNNFNNISLDNFRKIKNLPIINSEIISKILYAICTSKNININENSFRLFKSRFISNDLDIFLQEILSFVSVSDQSKSYFLNVMVDLLESNELNSKLYITLLPCIIEHPMHENYISKIISNEQKEIYIDALLFFHHRNIFSITKRNEKIYTLLIDAIKLKSFEINENEIYFNMLDHLLIFYLENDHYRLKELLELFESKKTKKEFCFPYFINYAFGSYGYANIINKISKENKFLQRQINFFIKKTIFHGVFSSSKKETKFNFDINSVNEYILDDENSFYFYPDECNKIIELFKNQNPSSSEIIRIFKKMQKDDKLKNYPQHCDPTEYETNNMEWLKENFEKNTIIEIKKILEHKNIFCSEFSII